MGFSPQYLAGLFDGEGYVYVAVLRRQQYALVGIANTHFGVLQALQAEFGGTLYPKKRRSAAHSQGWELRWSGSQKARMILSLMQPYLFIKKAEVEYLLENWFVLVRKTGRGHGWTEEELTTRAHVVARFKEIRAVERKVNQNELVN